MSLDDYKLIGPLTYGGKKDCQSLMCRRNPWNSSDCQGWHCSYCDEPTSYQGHHCDAGDTLLAASKAIMESGL